MEILEPDDHKRGIAIVCTGCIAQRPDSSRDNCNTSSSKVFLSDYSGCHVGLRQTYSDPFVGPWILAGELELVPGLVSDHLRSA